MKSAIENMIRGHYMQANTCVVLQYTRSDTESALILIKPFLCRLYPCQALVGKQLSPVLSPSLVHKWTSQFKNGEGKGLDARTVIRVQMIKLGLGLLDSDSGNGYIFL